MNEDESFGIPAVLKIGIDYLADIDFYELIDPAIKSVIDYLNAIGYETYDSCAGHEDMNEYTDYKDGKGQIAFKAEFNQHDKNRVKKILEEYGLKGVCFCRLPPELYSDGKYAMSKRTQVWFDAVGGPSSIREHPKVKVYAKRFKEQFSSLVLQSISKLEELRKAKEGNT